MARLKPWGQLQEGWYKTKIRQIAARENMPAWRVHYSPVYRAEARRHYETLLNPRTVYGRAIRRPDEHPEIVRRFYRQLYRAAMTTRGEQVIREENRRRDGLRSELPLSERPQIRHYNIEWSPTPRDSATGEGHSSYTHSSLRAVEGYMEGPTDVVVLLGKVWLIPVARGWWLVWFEDYDR